MKLPKLTSRTDKPRPYWHVDVKWMAGIVAVPVVAVWLATLMSWHATSPQVGIPLSTNVLAASFSGNLDDPEATRKLAAAIESSPTKSIKPIPNFPVVITEDDLDLSPRELRLQTFRQITEPIYYKGVEPYARTLEVSAEERQKFINDAAVIGSVTEERHKQLGRLALYLGVAAAVLIAVVVWASYRFGRLVSPAVVGVLAAVPGYTFSLGLQRWIDTAKAPEAFGQEFNLAQVLFQAKSALQPISGFGLRLYGWILVIAALLLVTALIGKIVYSIVKKRHKPGDVS